MLAPSYYFTRPIWCSPRKLTSSGRPRSMDETINGETDANRRAAAILEGVIGQSGCSRPIQRQWLRAVPNLWRSTSLARAVRW